MTKLLLIGVLSGCLVGITANAQEEGSAKKEPTAEQKQRRKEMIKKYDTNKDGKLSKDERTAMSKEDKQAMAKTRGVGSAGKGEKKQKGEKKKQGEKKEKGHREGQDDPDKNGA